MFPQVTNVSLWLFPVVVVSVYARSVFELLADFLLFFWTFTDKKTGDWLFHVSTDRFFLCVMDGNENGVLSLDHAALPLFPLPACDPTSECTQSATSTLKQILLK